MKKNLFTLLNNLTKNFYNPKDLYIVYSIREAISNSNYCLIGFLSKENDKVFGLSRFERLALYKNFNKSTPIGTAVITKPIREIFTSVESTLNFLLLCSNSKKEPTILEHFVAYKIYGILNSSTISIKNIETVEHLINKQYLKVKQASKRAKNDCASFEL